jgi:UDPglucose--hexose-1-phosphate uridylyltransferase
MRLNPLNGRWVTIVAERAQRPNDFAPRDSGIEDPSRPCPFCPGHEESTPPALETVDQDGTW